MAETDKKSIGISSLIALGLVLAGSIGPTYFESPKYYCEDESSILEASYGISGGQGTRLYLTEAQDSWDYCKSGWVEITDDVKIQEEEAEYEIILGPPIVYNQTGKQYICDQKGCEEVK